MTHTKRLPTHIATLLTSLALLCFALPAQAQTAGEPLLEAPLHTLPDGMTYDDYVAANMRITTGRTQGIIPGGVHLYAGDITTSRWLRFSAAMGLAAMIGGASQTIENTDPSSDFELVTLASGKQYEKIPVARTEGPDGNATNTEYILRPVSEQTIKPGGAVLVGLGISAIFGAYLYDIFEGIAAIEDKRNRGRFKYGKLQQAAKTKVSILPTVDPVNGGAGVSLGMQF